MIFRFSYDFSNWCYLYAAFSRESLIFSECSYFLLLQLSNEIFACLVKACFEAKEKICYKVYSRDLGSLDLAFLRVNEMGFHFLGFAAVNVFSDLQPCDRFHFFIIKM